MGLFDNVKNTIGGSLTELRKKKKISLDNLQKEIGDYYLGNKKNAILRNAFKLSTSNDTMTTLKKKVENKIMDDAFKMAKKYDKIGAFRPIGMVAMKPDPNRLKKKATGIFNKLKKGLPVKEIENILKKIKISKVNKKMLK